MLLEALLRPIRRLFVATLCLLSLAFASGCLTEDSVRAEFDDANYCETAEECVVIYPGCPLGCWAEINEAEVGRINDLVDDYHAQQSGTECLYDCPAHSEPICDNGRCVVESL